MTCYAKEVEGCYRIELRANKALLKGMGFTIDSLPILSEDLNVLDYIDFRRGLDANSFRRLVRLVLKKHFPNSRRESRRSRMAAAVKMMCIERMILEHISVGSTVSSDLSEWTTKPVAQQMDYFKELKKKHGLTSQVNEFFPSIALSQLVEVVSN